MSRHRDVVKTAIITLVSLATMALFGARVEAQGLPLDSLLAAHAHPIRLHSGTITGEGLELIMEAAATSQFVLVAEEHNVGALADFSAALFDTLHAGRGFNYIALEQGGVISRWLSRAGRSGGRDSINALARRWPHALTFATDQELDMISRIAKVSTADHDPVWGVDQEFGALHILERLAEIAPFDTARFRALELAALARGYEASRLGDTHYLSHVAVPGDFDDLPRLFNPDPGSEAEFLIDSVQRTSRIYHNNSLSRRGQPTGYENMRERETSMKTRFMEEYRHAQASGDSLPRVMLKLGHWHIYRGIYRGNVPTFGNFASELAVANGMDSFLLATWVIDGPEDWRNSSAFTPLALQGEQFTLIDFRPLRPYAHQGMIADLSDGWKSLFFRADAALIIRGGGTGSYNTTKGSQ